MASSSLETCIEHKLAIGIDQADKADRAQRGQWLRAAILGSNDGLLSTTSLMLGMAAASEAKWDMMLSGVAAAIAGACSMAVGEYVSVATQRDIEGMCMNDVKNSDSQLYEQHGIILQLIHSPPPAKAYTSCVGVPVLPACQRIQSEDSHKELRENAASMTPKRRSVAAASPGVSSPTMKGMSPARRSLFMSPKRSPMMRVISEDAREETNGDGYDVLPNPLKAGAASGLSFLCGAIIPLLSAMFVSNHLTRIILLVVVTTIALALFGGLGAHLGGSPVGVSAVRVLIGGWIAMGISYGLFKPFDNQKHEEKEVSGRT